MNMNLAEIFPVGYTQVCNSPKITLKFYVLAILGVFIEGMILFFLSMMRMDDSVEWTGELQLYVGAAVVLPVVIFVAGIVGARITSKQYICFDGETIYLNMKFRRPEIVKWNELGGMVRTGSIGFTLVDKLGKNVAAANISMTNYHAFYNMAIRQCKDYKKEQKKQHTGEVSPNTCRLGMERDYIILAVLACLGISVFIMAGLVELSNRFLDVKRFVQSLSAGKVILMMSVLPAVALSICLPLQLKRYWSYSDYGLELCYVFRKKEQISWAQIRRVQVGTIKTQRGYSYNFIIHTSYGKYFSGRLLTGGNQDFKLQVERMAKLYGFELTKPHSLAHI